MKTLADYLATEQAREDARRLLVAPYPRRIDAIVNDMPAVMSLYPADAWTRVSMTAQTFMRPGDPQDAGCYFRSDGDRYIVTDLGEGVRALRIKGCALLDIKTKVDEALMQMYQAGMLHATYGPVALIQGEIGTIGNVNASDLPDAICRVMLASLRVAGVGLTTNEGSAHAKG